MSDKEKTPEQIQQQKSSEAALNMMAELDQELGLFDYEPNRKDNPGGTAD
jgi:hypothetical protein